MHAKKKKKCAKKKKKVFTVQVFSHNVILLPLDWISIQFTLVCFTITARIKTNNTYCFDVASPFNWRSCNEYWFPATEISSVVKYEKLSTSQFMKEILLWQSTMRINHCDHWNFRCFGIPSTSLLLLNTSISIVLAANVFWVMACLH